MQKQATDPRTISAAHLVALFGEPDLSLLRADKSQHGEIYIITEGDDGPVKIGFTRNASQRLEALQTGNSKKLSLIAKIPGTQRDEILLQKIFGEYRIRGEWFERAPQIKVLIRCASQWRTSYRSQSGEKIPLLDWIETLDHFKNRQSRKQP